MEYHEIQMLAWAALGLTDEQTEELIKDPKDGGLNPLLMEELGVNLHQFQMVAEKLLKLTPLVEHAVTGELYNAFVLPGGWDGYHALIMEPGKED
jgi:hypothetical protein